MLTFSNARLAVGDCDLFESPFYRPVEVEARLVDQAIESLSAEQGLDARKNGLDGIQLRRVRYIVNSFNVQFPPLISKFLGFVHLQLVHEQCQGLPAVTPAQFSEIVEKIFVIDRVRMDQAQANSTLVRHGCDD